MHTLSFILNYKGKEHRSKDEEKIEQKRVYTLMGQRIHIYSGIGSIYIQIYTQHDSSALGIFGFIFFFGLQLLLLFFGEGIFDEGENPTHILILLEDSNFEPMFLHKVGADI